jgi:hypothetical protein
LAEASASLAGALAHPIHVNSRWQRVSQVNPDGTEGRPYWFDVETGATAWVPPPPPAQPQPVVAGSAADIGGDDGVDDDGSGGVNQRRGGGSSSGIVVGVGVSGVGAGTGGVGRASDGSLDRRPHRKFIPPEKVLEEWPQEGFLVGPNQELRCM